MDCHADQMKTIRTLFEVAMKAEWNEVVEIYREDARSYGAKITKSNDTILHIAVFDAQEKIVEELVRIMCRRDVEKAKKALAVQNEQGNTPLHIAASLGNVKMCHCIAQVDSSLLGIRNHDNETPLFLAVRHGKEEAFRCLYDSLPPCQRHQVLRCSGGDTILHAAIAGEYFNLAFQIIHLYDEPVSDSDHRASHVLVNSYNERAITPLHILASKPNAFRSGTLIKGYSHIIYHCTFVDDLMAEKRSGEHEYCKQAFKETVGTVDPGYPKIYETLIYFLSLVKKMIKIVTRTSDPNGDSQSPPGNKRVHRRGQFLPPIYDTCFDLVKIASKAILVVLGSGSSEISKIREKKEKHRWAAQLMNELLERSAMCEYEEGGTRPTHETYNFGEYHQYSEQDDGSNQNKETEGTPDSKAWKKETIAKTGTEETSSRLVIVNDDMMERMLEYFPEGNVDKKNIFLMAMRNYKPKVPDMSKIENPILLAAKNGITEMVEKILDKFPVAIHEMDADRKNSVLWAVEHRQPRVYQLLLDRYAKDSTGTTVKESVFLQVDNNGNSALHLAAMLGDYKPWLISGAALQMQWELKWYEFVENSMSYNSVLKNKAGKTPHHIFSTTHQELVRSGGEWLTHTSESCSVVAALIAAVAFATSTTVPGGVKEGIGSPTLENHPAFIAFAVSSLIALCFSVTSLIMFLAILTSRYQEKYFRNELPRKLLVGLSSLFVSIAAILVSYCAGHFFVLKHKLECVAFAVYAVSCLPVTFFAVAQFPLYFDLVLATLKKVPQRSYMVLPP